jgi:hypothetical protein
MLISKRVLASVLTSRSNGAVALAFAVAAGLLVPATAAALDLGFEALLSVDGSDNVNAVSVGGEGEIVEGTVGFGQFGVYGEQQGRIVRGAFSGEIESRQRLDDGDQNASTLTRFLGAANIAITPRSFSWYVGDILGGVRQDNAIQPINDADTRRRNVFVTGPAFEFDIDSFSRTRARLLYVNQSEDDVELESLYNASASWEKQQSSGDLWGLRGTDIYTVKPEDSDLADFNRASAVMFWQRDRRRLDLYAEVGGTRYDTDDNTVNGMAAQFSATRQLGPQQQLTLTLRRDLRDETLNTVESLIGDGAGVQPQSEGIFHETGLELTYGFQTNVATVDVGAGVTDSDYRLVGGQVGSADDQDQFDTYVFGYLTRSLTPRLRLQIGLRYEQLEYDRRRDETDSVLALADLVYRLNRSFQLEAGYRFNRAEGLQTDTVDNVITETDIDLTENRVRIGLRWAPRSRANKDLTVELKSLLQ